MTTVDADDRSDTTPVGERLRRASASTRRRLAAARRATRRRLLLILRATWRRTRWAGRGLRGAAGFTLVRIVWPALVRPVQSTKWPVRWHNLTDEIVTVPIQSLSTLWAAGWLWLAWSLGVPALGFVVAVLALPPLAFGIGRLSYEHTPRGLSRGKFHPESVADWPELRRHLSGHAVRKHAAQTRPTIARAATPPHAGSPSAYLLSGAPTLRRWPLPRRGDGVGGYLGRPWFISGMPVSRCGTWVGNTACGPPLRVRCYTAHENGVLLVGPPRSIKTSTMTGQIADEKDRALVCLQTKASTYHDTWVLRSDVGPVYLIDPENITGHKSNLRWAPQLGPLNRPLTAMEAAERAAAFSVAATKLGEDGEWLASQTGILLRAFLFFAGHAGKDMRDVYGWCTSADSAQAAVKLMESDEHRGTVPELWVKAAEGVLANKAIRTIGAIILALHECVGFMGDEAAAELCCPGPDEPAFDVPSFLRVKGSVYLVASDRPENKIGPLLSAFASYVTEEAKRIAGPLERERLEPGLLLSGDEAANTIPLDLPRLFSDSGGRGIQVVASVQSRSQLRQRYGKDGAETVWNSATTKLFAGGITVDADVESISKHSGTRIDRSGGRPEKVPGLTFDEVRRIPERHAALLHKSARMTIVRLPPPWKRPDVIAGRVRAAGRATGRGLRQIINAPAPPETRALALPPATTPEEPAA